MPRAAVRRRSQPVEPPQAERREQHALVGDAGLEHVVERADPVARDDEHPLGAARRAAGRRARRDRAPCPSRRAASRAGRGGRSPAHYPALARSAPQAGRSASVAAGSAHSGRTAPAVLSRATSLVSADHAHVLAALAQRRAAPRRQERAPSRGRSGLLAIVIASPPAPRVRAGARVDCDLRRERARDRVSRAVRRAREGSGGPRVRRRRERLRALSRRRREATTSTFGRSTKSVVSTLIGIAIDEGLITGVDATLGELLPAYRGAIRTKRSPRSR